MWRDLLEREKERVVDADDGVLRAVRDPGNLLGMEPDVERVEHRAHARHGEIQLEMTRRVPGEGRDAIARLDAHRLQGAREARCALADLSVRRAGCPVGGPGDDLDVGE